MYREEGNTTCPACLRTVSAVRNHKGDVIVSGHFLQIGTEKTELGYPVVDTKGFCPGSYEKLKG